jgi:hypothetical protein
MQRRSHGEGSRDLRRRQMTLLRTVSTLLTVRRPLAVHCKCSARAGPMATMTAERRAALCRSDILVAKSRAELSENTCTVSLVRQ